MDTILRGRDHPTLGVVEVRVPWPDVAIAITRGLHPKSYHYVDPNEDVVAVRRSGRLTALVVADGHNGHEGSHAAVDALLDALGEDLEVGLQPRLLVRSFHAANEALRAARAVLAAPNRGARTTMSLALVEVHGDGRRTLRTASVGDSVVLVAGGDGGVLQVTRDRHRFLGDRLSLPEVAGSLHTAEQDLAPGDVVAVASDGLTNFADLRSMAPSFHPSTPEEVARSLVDLAGHGGAGDNVAVAVLAAPDLRT